jgi:hypothetical protein
MGGCMRRWSEGSEVSSMPVSVMDTPRDRPKLLQRVRRIPGPLEATERLLNEEEDSSAELRRDHRSTSRGFVRQTGVEGME